MERRIAKEFLHLRDWFERAEAVTSAGREAYLTDPLRQEAGDSLLMKIGETANRLSRTDLAAGPRSCVTSRRGVTPWRSSSSTPRPPSGPDRCRGDLVASERSRRTCTVRRTCWCSAGYSPAVPSAQ